MSQMPLVVVGNLSEAKRREKKKRNEKGQSCWLDLMMQDFLAPINTISSDKTDWMIRTII